MLRIVIFNFNVQTAFTKYKIANVGPRFAIYIINQFAYNKHSKVFVLGNKSRGHKKRKQILDRAQRPIMNSYGNYYLIFIRPRNPSDLLTFELADTINNDGQY